VGKLFKFAFAVSAAVLASQAMAQIVFYEGEGFRGRSVVINQEVRNLDRGGFGNKAASVVVERGRWEVCERPRFEGRCAVLRRGNYDNLRGSGLEWNISSVRRAADGRRYDAEPQASTGQDYQYRRRASERVTEVPITSVRAIMARPRNAAGWSARRARPTRARPSSARCLAACWATRSGSRPRMSSAARTSRARRRTTR
jgi:hypothetical protein